MKPLFFILILLALCISLAAQIRDPRTFEQIAAIHDKTIVDYFLLCPAIVQRTVAEPGTPPKLVVATDESDFDLEGADLTFRKSLLTVGGSKLGPKVSSVLVDEKHAYIKIDGVNQGHYAFSLVFAFFDRADKSAIPALTFHYEEMESVEDRHAFFDLRGGSWKPIPDDAILPKISESPLLPYAGSGDTSSTAWALELPRYGTKIRFLPVRAFVEGAGDPQFAKGDEYLERLKPYALECSWDKGQARFKAPEPALAEMTDLSDGAPTAAGCFWFLRLPNSEDLGLDEAARRAACEEWKTSPKGQSKYGTNFFEWVGGGELGDINVRVRILGTYKGRPLVVEVDRQSQIYNFNTFLYHTDSGLLERVKLISFSAKDFYQPSRQAEARKAFGDEPFSCNVGLASDAPTLNFHPNRDNGPAMEELPPDYSLNFSWDDKTGAFVMTTEPY